MMETEIEALLLKAKAERGCASESACARSPSNPN